MPFTLCLSSEIQTRIKVILEKKKILMAFRWAINAFDPVMNRDASWAFFYEHILQWEYSRNMCSLVSAIQLHSCTVLVQHYKELSSARMGVVCLSSPHLYSTVTHRHIQLLLFQAFTYTVAEATMSIRVYLDNHTLHHKALSQFLWAEWLLH